MRADEVRVAWVPDDGVPVRCLRCGREKLPHRPAQMTLLRLATIFLAMPFLCLCILTTTIALLRVFPDRENGLVVIWRTYCVWATCVITRDIYRWVDRRDAWDGLGIGPLTCDYTEDEEAAALAWAAERWPAA